MEHHTNTIVHVSVLSNYTKKQMQWKLHIMETSVRQEEHHMATERRSHLEFGSKSRFFQELCGPDRHVQRSNRTSISPYVLQMMSYTDQVQTELCIHHHLYWLSG